jgi:lipopolysaccharide export system ATP-binding protein
MSSKEKSNSEIFKSDTLYARGLVKQYNNRTVVNDVNFEVTQGEIVGLLGPNGAGKTTSFYMVVGLIKPDAGNVYLGNQDVTEEAMYQRARIGLTYLPQEPSVFRKLSVIENILAVLEVLPEYAGNPDKQYERLKTLMSELNLQKVASAKGYALSGGERRRVEIARALACNPKFMLLDEPFAGIDPIVVSDLQELVIGLQQKGIGILITDHNVRETLKICTRGYILSEGKVVESGSPEHIAASPIARKYYLGENFDF